MTKLAQISFENEAAELHRNSVLSGVSDAGWSPATSPTSAHASIVVSSPTSILAAGSRERPLLELVVDEDNVRASYVQQRKPGHTEVSAQPDIENVQQIRQVVRRFLADREVHPRTPSEQLGELVEGLVGLLGELAADSDRLRQLLAQAEIDNRNLELEVERYRDMFTAWRDYGLAVTKGTPVSAQEAKTLAEGTGRTLALGTGGGLAANGLTWTIAQGWDELQEIVQIINAILEIAL